MKLLLLTAAAFCVVMAVVTASTGCATQRISVYPVISPAEMESLHVAGETFDLELYGKRDNFGRITLDDKTKLNQFQYINSPNYLEYRYPAGKYYSVAKEFYPDLRLMRREIRLLGGMRIGTGEYYDEQGNKTVVNFDEQNGFERHDYNRFVRQLIKRGYDIRSDYGGLLSDATKPTVNDIRFYPEKRQWVVSIWRPRRGHYDYRFSLRGKFLKRTKITLIE